MGAENQAKTLKWTRESKLGQPAYRSGPYLISRRFESGYLGGGRQRSRMFFVVSHDGIDGNFGHFYTLKSAKAWASAWSVPLTREALTTADVLNAGTEQERRT